MTIEISPSIILDSTYKTLKETMKIPDSEGFNKKILSELTRVIHDLDPDTSVFAFRQSCIKYINCPFVVSDQEKNPRESWMQESLKKLNEIDQLIQENNQYILTIQQLRTEITSLLIQHIPIYDNPAAIQALYTDGVSVAPVVKADITRDSVILIFQSLINAGFYPERTRCITSISNHVEEVWGYSAHSFSKRLKARGGYYEDIYNTPYDVAIDKLTEALDLLKAQDKANKGH